ncbi:hypothetical protein [Pseudomonas sp. NMI542_15]|uniref:hypothetical protein n=1 Tax=Pseudomonas sp. NMI542_15 TaxID=2903148 RepID=UPI001E5C9F3B|nr:hypothetical protein [Pseudomonas sp. NMI542_15]MCE0782289.1 hypothetical protein [Pseudomonas sp. NMI542_15]
MKKLYDLVLLAARIADGLVSLTRNYSLDNPWVIQAFQRLLVVSGILIAALSASLWHMSATLQEDVVQLQNLDQAQVLSTTIAAATLNTQAALCGVVVAVLNGLYFWLESLKVKD